MRGGVVGEGFDAVRLLLATGRGERQGQRLVKVGHARDADAADLSLAERDLGVRVNLRPPSIPLCGIRAPRGGKDTAHRLPRLPGAARELVQVNGERLLTGDPLDACHGDDGGATGQIVRVDLV